MRRAVRAGGWAQGTLLAELANAEPDPSGAAWRELSRAGTTRVYARRESLLLAGARDSFVLLLLDGFGKVTAADRAGAEVLVDIRAAGDVIGEMAAFDDRVRSATVTAAQQMRALRISQQEWLRWTAGTGSASLAVHRTLAHRSRTAVRRRTEFARGPVVARLARAVLDLAGLYGVRTPQGVRVEPGLTQVEWADLVGARERRAHHALRELSAAGAISFGRCRLTVVSTERLRDFAALTEDDR